MMNLCQKTISSSLPPSNTMDNKILSFPYFQAHQNSVFFKGDHPNPNPMAENSSFPFPQPPPTSSNIDNFFKTAKMDPPGIGFLDDIGGSVDGLMSCTESLGFESSDERRVDDLIENLDEMEEYCLKKKKNSKNFNSKAKLVEKRKSKMFPPPLSSMSQDGKPVSFLQPMRIDGRLKLTEVRLFKAPEVLRASREDGRLRLHLIQDHDENEDKQDEKDEEIDGGGNDKMKLEALLDAGFDVEDDEEEEEGSSRLDTDDDEEGTKRREESRLLPQSGGDDGLILRCHDQRRKLLPAPPLYHHHRHQHQHDMHRHQHQHDMHVWRQQLMC